MDQSNQNKVVVADADAVAASDQRENPPPYLKLIADCWEHIFDYLSFEDIHRMGETCKRMQQMAGYYVREYIPEQYLYLIKDKVRTEILHDSFQLRTDFCQYIRKLDISEKLKHFLDADTFPSLKKLIFGGEIRLSEKQVQYTRNILKNVEKVSITYGKIFDPKSIEQLIAYSPKMKHLVVRHCDMSFDAVESIFLQDLPTLEHLEYQTWSPMRIDELKTFLEKHTNTLKSFESDYEFIWTNRDLLIDTHNIQLNVLAINVDTPDIPFDTFVDFLKTLHSRGFYKKLHLKFDDESQHTDVDHVSNIISTVPALEMWTSYENAMLIDFSRLTNLKELHVTNFETFYPDPEIDVENIAKSLTNLERLGIHSFNYDGDIQPFIRHSKKLKSIKLKVFSSGHDVDLFALNEDRKKLDDACQTTIYAEERIYLPSKWKSSNVNLSHVELRRF